MFDPMFEPVGDAQDTSAYHSDNQHEAVPIQEAQQSPYKAQEGQDSHQTS